MDNEEIEAIYEIEFPTYTYIPTFNPLVDVMDKVKQK